VGTHTSCQPPHQLPRINAQCRPHSDSSDFDDFEEILRKANPPRPQPIAAHSSDPNDDDDAFERSSSILGENEGAGNSDNGGDTSEDDDIPNPPDDIQAPTIEALQTAVNAWEKKRGFAVIRRSLLSCLSSMRLLTSTPGPLLPQPLMGQSPLI